MRQDDTILGDLRASAGRVMRVQLPIWLVAPMLGLTLVIGLGGGYLGGQWLQGPPTACPEPADVCARFENFWKTWDLAEQQYVDPSAVRPSKMIDGAIEGMLGSLGDTNHTRYLSPEAAKSEREELSGRFEGIGAYIDVRDGQPIILQPIEGTPAAQAGLRANDVILKVDGQDMSGIGVGELRDRVRGPKDTVVMLTIQRAGEPQPLEFTITRATIDAPSVTWRMLPNDVALINMNQFAERSSEEMKQALDTVQQQGATSIVLDLRNNPGGYVTELIGVASQFLPPDTTVLIEQDRQGKQTPYKTTGDGSVTGLPLVVLINQNSASSAEILAGALKEAGRARLIGEPTFGTATVLRTFNLNDGAQVRLGTTQWLTPQGEVVRGKGIEPDEIVALAPDVAPLTPTRAADLDPQALSNSDDKQLVRALEVLKTLAQK